MTETLLKRINYALGLLATAGIFAIAILLANIEIKDLDLWLHLAMGRFIALHHVVPAVDVLSCTIAGKPWINHEWLFQILIYWFHGFGQADGIIFMQVLVVALTLGLLILMGYDKDRPLTFLIPLFLLVFIYKERFTIRPDLFSLFFLTTYFYLLGFHLSKRWFLPVIFVLQVLWSNMHGFFIWGPIMIGLTLLGEALKRSVKLPFEWNTIERLDKNEIRQLQLALVIAFGACFLNPMRWKGALYPFGVFFQFFDASKIFFEKILELQRPFENWESLWNFDQYSEYKLLIVLSVLSFIFIWRRINMTVLLYWAIFLLFSLSAIRNLVYFAFAAYFACIVNFSQVSLKTLLPDLTISRKSKLILLAALKLYMILYLVDYGQRLTYNGYFDFDTYERKSEFGGISLRNFPYKAVDFLVENKVAGNFFNDFNSGAYLVGRGFPDIKVTIDGRTELYGSEFFRRHDLAWKGDRATFVKMDEQYHFSGAFLNTVQGPVPAKLLQHLYADKDWTMVYFDYDAVIFLRNTEANKEVIEKFTVDVVHWKPKVLDLQKLGLRNVTPYQNMHRARSLMSLGISEAALGEAREALRVMPNYADAHKVTGEIYLKLANADKAFESLRVAKLLNSSDMETRYDLAKVFELKKDWDKALEQAQIALQDNPGRGQLILLTARLLTQKGQYAKVLDYVKAVPQLTALELDDLLSVADLLYMKEQYAQAKEVYQGALTITNSAEIHHRIGLCYRKLGDLPSAQKEFETTLALNPDHRSAQKNLESLQIPGIP